MLATLPAFPSAREGGVALYTAAASLGLDFRAANAADLIFLRELYGMLRADELGRVLWPADVKGAFVDSQFALQHRHFVTHFPKAHFLVLEREGQRCGRFYLDDEEAADLHIVDIALLPAMRGNGIGSSLLRATQSYAAVTGRGVMLYVEKHNVSAQRLYKRLGFRVKGEEALHYRLRWQVS